MVAETLATTLGAGELEQFSRFSSVIINFEWNQRKLESKVLFLFVF